MIHTIIFQNFATGISYNNLIIDYIMQCKYALKFGGPMYRELSSHLIQGIGNPEIIHGYNNEQNLNAKSWRHGYERVSEKNGSVDYKRIILIQYIFVTSFNNHNIASDN